MKRLFSILFLLLPLCLMAQVLQPVKWNAEQKTDSVVITAKVDAGWHMAIHSLNVGGEERMVAEVEYTDEAKFAFPNTTIRLRYNACDDRQCTAPEWYEYSPMEVVSADEAKQEPMDKSLWWVLAMGLLGGLLAIFTPCVWPIIPMTVSFFMKKEGAHAVRDAAIYGLSIVLIYVGLGLLVTLLFGASALNALSTNAVVNLFFFALMVVFALSFFGLFEITLPSSWSTRLDSKARETSGILSILLMAFTLVIVSFSCTGPIIGTLLVEAAGKSLLAPAVGMLGFAMALALPFSLFALFPNWMKRVPRSGGWMDTFKVTLAFIELALSLKFLSVADLAYGWGILPRWLFIGLWTAIFLALGIYLITRRQWVCYLLALCSLSFSGYLLPGVWGEPVRLVSAFAPPMEIEGREVFTSYEEGLAYAKQEHKQVLLDFTGYGCVNCRKMEAYVLSDERVKAELKDWVVVTLYVDDKNDGIGEKNSQLQRERFGANAQPYFVKLNDKGEQIGEAFAFSTDADEFMRWLSNK